MSDTDQLEALDRLHRLFEAEHLEYWLFGGWAVDFHAGAVTRPHGDLNVFGALANRHSGGGNVAYCDGHARWNKMEAAHKIENFRTQN